MLSVAYNLEKWGSVGYNLVCILKDCRPFTSESFSKSIVGGVSWDSVFDTPGGLSCIKVLRSVALRWFEL